MAKDVLSNFKEHSVAEFFKKNRQMLGFSGKIRSLTTLVHEYVTNSLDACEENGILPDITVKLEENADKHIIITVQDNGPGLPKKLVGKALGMMLAGTKFHRYVQQRGQQGIGAAGASMYSQITTGKPVWFKTGTGDGKAYEGLLKIDFKTNRPTVTDEKEYDEEFRGLVVKAEFAEVKYDRSDKSPSEYLKRTALANPHAQILFVEPSGERVLFPRASDKIPKKAKEVQPHPLGITTHDLMDFAHASQERKLSSFFVRTFQRFSQGKVKELNELLPEIDFNKRPQKLEWHEAEKLIAAFDKVKWIAPETTALIPIGAEQLEKAMQNIYNAEFMTTTERKPKVFRGGIPFMVEAALAYGGNAGKRRVDGKISGDILRFSNKVPLLFDAGGCGLTESVKNMDWKRYNIRDFDNEPVSVLINFVSVHVPYTGAGKQAIVNEEEIVTEVRNAVMEAARQMQRYLQGKIKTASREKKKKAIMKYIPQLAQDLPELAGKGASKTVEKELVRMVQDKYDQTTLTEVEDEEEEEKPEESLDDAPENGEKEE